MCGDSILSRRSVFLFWLLIVYRGYHQATPWCHPAARDLQRLPSSRRPSPFSPKRPAPAGSALYARKALLAVDSLRFPSRNERPPSHASAAIGWSGACETTSPRRTPPGRSPSGPTPGALPSTSIACAAQALPARCQVRQMRDKRLPSARSVSRKDLRDFSFFQSTNNLHINWLTCV